jgi:uncharacterized membrane protein
MAGKRKVPNGWALIVIGLILAALGLFMFRDGQHHKRQYEDFQACKASDTPICILRQDGSEARSEAEFKKNYENQFLIGTILMSLGGLLVLAGVVALGFRRRPSASPTQVANQAPSHPAPLPAAGWYQDPADRGAMRWWDGQRWTEHTSGPPPK